MDSVLNPDVLGTAGENPLIVGPSELPETMIPSSFKDFIWCDSADFPYLANEVSFCPVIVSWRSSSQLAEIISHSGPKGAWVLADSMEKVADVSALDSEFRLTAVDSLDEVPFLYLEKESEAEELPSRVLLGAVVATVNVENRRRLNRQGVVDEIAKNIATESSSSSYQRVVDSPLRRRIKSLLNGREKQLAAKLPRPLFRFALKIWKAM